MTAAIKIHTASCARIKNTFVFGRFEGRFPDSVTLVNKGEVEFKIDVDAAVDAEFWDGEEMHYFWYDDTGKKWTLILTH